MPLIKLLHISALICWCGTLLYLPALVAAGTRRSDDLFYRDHAHLTRMVFTLIATPAALVAIISGTALFFIYGLFELWLIFKLAAVTGLVLCHALFGVLILHIERTPEKSIAARCTAIGLFVVGLIGLTLWLVLAKPY
ncbi:CopD family protein [Pseudomonas matsuisoli]|uniref:Protoporphyrinogen IX oxidase n=1 Tax=Pseudomonas matsuisoli TaxID=1515666 RepID=A0A917UTD2_9PSED|nr:CopD family protein [Pseudomonas matsuisoli]GGJ83681.1 hypothetical protein GCM10009304_07070 [Pseudomonas matsuisoli]